MENENVHRRHISVLLWFMFIVFTGSVYTHNKLLLLSIYISLTQTFTVNMFRATRSSLATLYL
jgi:hypothetical protein